MTRKAIKKLNVYSKRQPTLVFFIFHRATGTAFALLSLSLSLHAIIDLLDDFDVANDENYRKKSSLMNINNSFDMSRFDHFIIGLNTISFPIIHICVSREVCLCHSTLRQ